MSKNFFITGISGEEKKKLEESKVSFVEFKIDEGNGVVIEEGEIKKLADVLGVSIDAEEKTSYEGIIKAVLKKKTSIAPEMTKEEKPGVKIWGEWDGQNSSEFKRITEEILLPILDRKIIISVPHKKIIEPKNDGIFRIFIWASPVESKIAIPDRIWGVSVDCQDNGFAPAGQGIAIRDESTGYAVAELVGDSLFIHHDICHKGTSRELEIFSRLLKETAFEISATPKEKEERKNKRLAEAQQKSRREYMEMCSARLAKTLHRLEESRPEGKQEIEKLQRSLVAKIREVQETERMLNQLLVDKNKELEKYGQEFDKLLTVKGVRDVKIDDETIEVFTDILYCVNPGSGKRHEIGAFRIEIYPSGSHGGVRWFNLTRQVEGCKENMQAPHIYDDGHACFGNIKEIVPELIANYEFAALAMVAIQFVESVNVDDGAGKYIYRWPEVAEVKE